ncbi:unnamed protein product [Ixodes hexagonus]
MRGDCLPPELRLIAETELGETDQGRTEALERLNRLLDEEPELNSRRDDEFLLRFLRVRKYDVDAALKKLKEYYRTRKEYPSVLENLVPSNVKPSARKVAMVLPQRDAHGRPVILLKAGAWDPQTTSYGEALQALSVAVEHVTMDPVAQTIGVSCMTDYDGFTADKIVSVNFGLLKMSLKLLLNCVPVRIKAIHSVRESYAFDMAYAMIRHFLSKKTTDRIHFHGQNFEGLYKDMPVDMLPKEYGGLAPDFDFDAYWSGLEKADASYAENNNYGYLGKQSCSEEIEVTAF